MSPPRPDPLIRKVTPSSEQRLQIPVTSSYQEDWQFAPRLPCRTLPRRHHTLLEASQCGRPVLITYLGGTAPHEPRAIIPLHFYSVEGYEPHLYLDALCLERDAPRTFRLDRITSCDLIHYEYDHRHP